MIPPKSVKVMHLFWDIILVDPAVSEQATAYGWADKIRQRIYLQANLRPRMLCETVCHELGHACFHACGMADDGLTEEQVCSQLTGPMLCVFSENPQLVAWLQFLLNPRLVMADGIDDGAYV